MKLIMIPVLLLLCLAIGCGKKDPHNMTYSEVNALPDSAQQALRKQFTEDESQAIAATGMKYMGGPDSAKFQKMTLQEMIDEGHKIQKGDTAKP